MTLLAVQKDASALDILAERYRLAFNKTKAGRAEWIEGTLELAVVVAEARDRLRDHKAFSRWTMRNQLEALHPNDRAALVGMAKDLPASRKLLEASRSISWRVIWEKRPNKAQSTYTKIGKSAPRRDTRHPPRNRIPDAMREEAQPEPKPVRGGTHLKALTREQVDPDFVGTALEFRTKYGHVNLHTKEQIEYHKHQDRLTEWLAAVTQGARAAQLCSAVDPATLQQWANKPGKAEKVRLWCKAFENACDQLRELLKP